MHRKRLKLRPRYFWLGGIFMAIVGVVATVAAMSGEPEESHATGKTMADITYMQDMTAEICKNTPTYPTAGYSATLIDKRGTSESDYISYTVAKLQDGNCWMTQNLQIIDETLTSADSDLPTGTEFILPATSTKADFKSTNVNTKQVYFGSDSLNNTVYYNWYTATAGSGNASVTTGNVNVTSSICPKGWELPTGGASGQFQALATAIGNTSTSTWRGAPYNFVATGNVDAGGLFNTSNGFYWSRTSNSGTNAYSLYMNSSTVYPQDSGVRYVGFAVRCVAKNALEETGIITMQQMTADVCAKADVGDTATLKDERDDKYYTVAKIADKVGDGENCWMTQNLQLDLEQYWNKETMVTSLSDVPSDDYWTQRDIGSLTKTLRNTGGFPNDNTAIQYTNTLNSTELTVANGTYDSSYGYYYSWCAATVGCKNSSGSNPTAGVDAVASICPKGWQLPSGDTNGQWYNLLNGTAQISNSYITPLAADPYKIPAAGVMGTNGFNAGGTIGYYWSRTANADTRAYGLNFIAGALYPGTDSNGRYIGYSVRCVNNPDVHGLPENPNKDSTSADFSVTVNDAITLSSVEFSNSDGTSNTISAMPGQLATGSINVNVGSNVKYKITMNSQLPDLASKTNDNINVIPAITTTMTADQLKTNYGWGVMKKNTDNTTDDTAYTGLNSQDQTFYTSDEPAGASKVTNFGVGVGVPPTIPADTYSTEVTITAIATE